MTIEEQRKIDEARGTIKLGAWGRFVETDQKRLHFAQLHSEDKSGHDYYVYTLCGLNGLLTPLDEFPARESYPRCKTCARLRQRAEDIVEANRHIPEDV